VLLLLVLLLLVLLLVLLLLLQKLGYGVHEVKAVPLDGPGSLAGLERCCEGQQARQQAQVRGCICGDSMECVVCGSVFCCASQQMVRSKA
jgi:hypothetical protein